MSQIQQLAALAQSYQQAYESGQLSAQDYKQLVEDLNIAGHVQANAAELEQDQMSYQILMGVVALAQVASSL
jgi:tape measure domain-containing protein